MILNNYKIKLLSQNNPVNSDLKYIANDVMKYGHTQLHLSGNIRKGNPKLKFSQLVNKIREYIGINPL